MCKTNAKLRPDKMCRWSDANRAAMNYTKVSNCVVCFVMEQCSCSVGYHSCYPECLLKADSHIACRAHAVPLTCRAAKSLECVFPI
jgi:hypothetical protein